MIQGKWTIVAFLVAPIIPATGLALLTVWSFSALAIVPLYYIYALPLTSVFSVPSYFVGKRLGLIRWWSALIVGIIIGTLWGWLFMKESAYAPEIVTPLFFSEQVLKLSALGALAGVAFWWIWSLGSRTNP